MTKEPRIAVTLSADEHKVLMLAALKYKMTKSKIVAQIVRDWVEEFKPVLVREDDVTV